MRVLNIEGMEACLHFTSQTGALLEGCTLNKQGLAAFPTSEIGGLLCRCLI